MMRFGRMKCSRSMIDSATSAPASTRNAGSAHECANRAPTAAKSTAVSTSMSGYRAEIELPQLRQRPRSASHDTTGMLSRLAIFVSQPGQCDGGVTIDSLRGTRQITTLRNEPMTSPYMPLIAATSAVTTVEARRGTGADRASRARRETRTACYHVACQLGSVGIGEPLAAHPLAPSAAFAYLVVPAASSSRT